MIGPGGIMQGYATPNLRHESRFQTLDPELQTSAAAAEALPDGGGRKPPNLEKILNLKT